MGTNKGFQTKEGYDHVYVFKKKPNIDKAWDLGANTQRERLRSHIGKDRNLPKTKQQLNLVY